MIYQTPQVKQVTTYSPSLQSEVTGEVDQSGIAVFRGIPYATLTQRWTQSRVRHTLESPFDATKYGPRCPQAFGPVLVSGGVMDPTPGDNEFECLNLNIATPHSQILSTLTSEPCQGLPVLVWIHGGAFNYGANSVARYRPQALSSLAADIGKPVVLVQINYRLGAFGFAVSNDLADEQDRLQPCERAEYLGNFGLVDQQNALLWVKQHIADFGGDPNNVTAFGVSAGSASVHDHILSGTPHFDRAIMMSGTAGSLGPLPFDLYEKDWQKLADRCQVGNITPAERLARLRSLTADELIELYSDKAMGPHGDGKLLPKEWTYGDAVPANRCMDAILGDTRVEGIIFDGFSKRLSQQAFLKLLKEIMADDQTVDEFCSQFGLNAAEHRLGNLPYEVYRNGLRLFFSVATFQFPTLRVAETFASSPQQTCGKSRSTYLYHFEQDSPWPGPTQGHAYHGQCALFLFLNQIGTEGFPDTAEKVCYTMAERWISFAYGEQPWQPFDPEGQKNEFMRFGPLGESGMTSMENDSVRPYHYLPWTRVHGQEVRALCRRLLHEG